MKWILFHNNNAEFLSKVKVRSSVVIKIKYSNNNKL